VGMWPPALRPGAASFQARTALRSRSSSSSRARLVNSTSSGLTQPLLCRFGSSPRFHRFRDPRSDFADQVLAPTDTLGQPPAQQDEIDFPLVTRAGVEGA